MKSSELDELFEKLKKTNNPMTARKLRKNLEIMDNTSFGRKLNKSFSKGSEYMAQNQLTSAHNVFSKAIELDPNWAEAWNKRATVLYLMGNLELSQMI